MSNPQMPQSVRPSQPPSLAVYDHQIKSNNMTLPSSTIPNMGNVPINPGAFPFRFSSPSLNHHQQSHMLHGNAPPSLIQQQRGSSDAPPQHLNNIPYHLTPAQFLSNQHQQPLHNFPTSSSLSHQTATSSSAVVTSTTTSSTTVPSKTADSKDWQDGLRALLPNINISFAGEYLKKTVSYIGTYSPLLFCGNYTKNR